eukprot:764539-Hanusia_phi.AAC.3
MKKEEISSKLKELPVTRRATYFSVEFTAGEKLVFIASDGSSAENGFGSSSSPGHSLLSLLSQLKTVNMLSNDGPRDLQTGAPSVNNSSNHGIENEIRKTFEETSQVKHETEKIKGSWNIQESSMVIAKVCLFCLFLKSAAIYVISLQCNVKESWLITTSTSGIKGTLIPV